MRRMRPTEVRAVAAILEEPAEDTAELATRILRKVNEMRAEEYPWVVQTYSKTTGRTIAMWGPYLSAGEARRAIERDINAVDKAGAHARLWRLVDTSNGEGEVEDE